MTSHYTDYNGFPYTTEVGQYIIKKVYFIINLRRTIKFDIFLFSFIIIIIIINQQQNNRILIFY